jgi:hypothetical protein
MLGMSDNPKILNRHFALCAGPSECRKAGSPAQRLPSLEPELAAEVV